MIHNPVLNPVRFALWTLCDKAAQRRLALRSRSLRALERLRLDRACHDLNRLLGEPVLEPSDSMQIAILEVFLRIVLQGGRASDCPRETAVAAVGT